MINSTTGDLYSLSLKISYAFWFWRFFLFIFFFLIQFYIPFKIISAHMRRANQQVERKRENPEKKTLAHPQADLGLSHIWPVRGSNPHQTQRWDDRVIKKQRS